MPRSRDRETPFTVPVSAVMTKKVFTVRPDDDVETAVEMMKMKMVRRLPVVDDQDNVVGPQTGGSCAGVNRRSCYIRRCAAVDGVFTHRLGWEVRPRHPTAVFADVVGGDLHDLAPLPAIRSGLQALHRCISKSEAAGRPSGGDLHGRALVARWPLQGRLRGDRSAARACARRADDSFPRPRQTVPAASIAN